MMRLDAIQRVSPLKAAAGLLLALALAGCGPSGPATTVNQPTGTGAPTSNYTGPAPSSKDVQAFEVSLWNNVRTTDRCGGCHYAGGQSPQFARSDDVNLAYQAALPLVNTSVPGQSTLVQQVGGGHNCWVAAPQACADTMLTWIQNWIGGGAGASVKVQLIPPPNQSVGGTKTFPSDPTSFQSTVYPLLTRFCSACHDPNSATPQAPYFASSNVDQAYLEAQPKMNLDDPAASRFVERLADESHHCWPTSGSSPDCPGSAAQMLTAITNFANTIPATTVPSSWVISKALMLQQGIIASGGSRYDADTIAKYEFKEGTGSIAYDTSGVSPESDLTVSGNVTWDQAWGVIFAQGSRAQALTTTSQKITNLVQTTGEYSVEVWASPANITQTKANIVSYSGSDTTRDVTLSQDAVQYEAETRSDKTNTNGDPPLQTAVAGSFVQAALQHIVLTYDPVNGQRLYVNGQFTGDVDPNGGGSLASWDNTFALVLGNETTGDRQWLGEIRFLAIHDSALTPAQVLQNFNASVGQKYFLLFDVSSIVNIPESYIMLTAAQYDNYSYLFYDPTFVTLTAGAQPQNIPIAGLRIGINGQIPTVGQSYSTLNTTIGGTNYTAGNGQLLSSVGAVIGVDTGMASDMFFLSFDQLGNQTNVYVEPVVPPNPTVYDNTPQPDLGVHMFAEINASMSVVTGVPVSDSVVSAQYTSVEQSLPAVPQITAYTASEQTAVSQLASSYCSELVNVPQYSVPFFGATLNANLGQPASWLSGAGNQNLVITPLVTALSVGTTVDPTYATALQNELGALLTRIPTLTVSPAPTVATATQAACQAALGSAALMLK